MNNPNFNTMRTLNLIGFLTLAFCSNLVAQDFLRQKPNRCSDCQGQTKLLLEGASFIKNNEYFGPYTEGFTGLGFFLKPQVQFHLSDRTRLDAGWFVLQYYGQEGFNPSLPIFRLQHQLKPGIELILGSLYGSTQHGLEEPLFRIDRYYQNQMEYGAQLLIEKKRFTADLWVNWEQFIEPGDSFQEHLEAGLVADFILYDRNYRLDIPIQGYVRHKGGQIDASPLAVSTIFNGMWGLRWTSSWEENRSLSISSLYFGFTSDLPAQGANALPISQGKGWMFRTQLNWEGWQAMMGYWRGNNFMAPKGEYLFSSLSDFNPNYSDQIRRVLMAKVIWSNTSLDAIDWGWRTDAYWDRDAGEFNYALAVFMQFQLEKLWELGR